MLILNPNDVFNLALLFPSTFHERIYKGEQNKHTRRDRMGERERKREEELTIHHNHRLLWHKRARTFGPQKWMPAISSAAFDKLLQILKEWMSLANNYYSLFLNCVQPKTIINIIFCMLKHHFLCARFFLSHSNSSSSLFRCTKFHITESSKINYTVLYSV